MSEVQRRIEELVHSGRVTPDEGRELSRAAAARGARHRWLLDPFARLSTAVGLGVGIGVMVLQLAISRAGVRFDGALDMHFVRSGYGWIVSLLEALVSWPLVSLALWLAALVAGKRPRAVDALWTVGVARLPLVLSAMFRPLVRDPAELARVASQGHPPARMLWLALVVLPFLCWFLFWLYRAYCTASGLAGRRAAVSFIVALVVAELISKVILASFLGPTIMVEQMPR